MPPDTTALFFPTLHQNRSNAEDDRHNVSRVTSKVKKPSIRLGSIVTEKEFVTVEYGHPGKVNVMTPIPGGKLYPGETVREGHGDREKPDNVDTVTLSHLSQVDAGKATRGSNVRWGSKDGVVHIRRWPRHKPKKHLVVTDDAKSPLHEEMINKQETEELSPHTNENGTTQPNTLIQRAKGPSTQTHEERTLEAAVNTEEIEDASVHPYADMRNTNRTEEISTIVQEVWTTNSPEVENWFTDAPKGVTDTPEEILTNSEDRWEINGNQGWETVDEENSTEVFEDKETSIYEDSEWSSSTPEEQLTVLPEEWLSTTPHPEDDWLTIIPQDKQLTDIQEDLQSDPSLPPTPPSISPAPSTMFPPLHTPTIPPSLPPTPSPQDAMEDSLRITTRGLDFLLEASPTGQLSPDTTEFPKDDLFTLDLTITTTREGLNADARDVTFDPSQIAKATSYEGSSYPTATRSATVTTTWVEEAQLSTADHQNLTVNDELVNIGVVGDLSEVSTKLQQEDLASEDGETSTLPVSNDVPVLQQDVLSDETYKGSDTHTLSGTYIQTSISMTDENDLNTTAPTTLKSSIDTQESDRDSREDQESTFEYVVHLHEINTSGHNMGGPPVDTTNTTDGRSDSNVVKVSSNKTDEAVMYEIPVVTRNPSQVLNPSVVVALSVCCAVVMVLAALSVVLWVCRRHRNRSKIYLSREAAKPRAFFTRPMNPAVLPEESDHEDAVYMLEFQRPRPPVMLGSDRKGIYFIKRDEGDGSEECRASVGVENGGFIDVPLGEVRDNGQARIDPPKYDLKSKQDSDADSGIRVWSSTGSLHAASSPLPTHCRVPPPPYSPSISKESVCLSVHSLPSLPRNSQLFDV